MHFSQTPTLNARPIVRAIKQTCRRNVEVVLFLDLGMLLYPSEGLRMLKFRLQRQGRVDPIPGWYERRSGRPFIQKAGQGEEGAVPQGLLVCSLRWNDRPHAADSGRYTGKDQVRPLNAVIKQRNCHIKFAAYDDQVLIIGNGNQGEQLDDVIWSPRYLLTHLDSQSWFHSQEVNVMIDSKQLVAEMMDTLMSNQNTLKYGLVSPDGIWRDDAGKTLQDYGATGSDKFRGLSAFINIIKSI